MTKDIPIPDAIDTFQLDVGDGHSIYVEHSGNPDGLPLIMCHGGPGSRSKPAKRTYVDAEKFHLIQFDQRNCGQSTPRPLDDRASLAANTPQAIVSDMEKIRTHFGFENWHVAGASWGSTVATLYGASYPRATRSLTLAAFFMGQESEWQWMVTGARMLAPEQFKKFSNMFPDVADNDLMKAYADKILTSNDMEAGLYGRLLLATEHALEILTDPKAEESAVADPAAEEIRVLNNNLIYAHFLQNHMLPNGWFTRDEVKAALKNIDTAIIHGRVDTLCPAKTAFDFVAAHPHAKLELADNAGHGVDLNGNQQRLLNKAYQRLLKL